MQRALIVGLGLGPLCGIMGVFMTLRGLSFFGDAIAHVSLVGIAFSLLLGLTPQTNGVLFTLILVGSAVLAAMIIALLLDRPGQRPDTILAVVFTACMAIGMVVITRTTPTNPNQALVDYLFGSIYSTRAQDIGVILGLLILAVALILLFRRPLILLTLNREYAQALGIPVSRINRLFIILLALTVAVSVRFLGALLVSALLVIPAAAARNWAGSFARMLIIAAIIGFVATEGGVVASFKVSSLPTGPAIVLIAALFFGLSILFPLARRR